jgi:hypothetical protein
MWYPNKTVVATHAKDGTRMAWAIISGIAGWKRIRPNSPDGVTNLHLLLSTARANNRKVDVYIVSNQITQATLK